MKSLQEATPENGVKWSSVQSAPRRIFGALDTTVLLTAQTAGRARSRESSLIQEAPRSLSGYTYSTLLLPPRNTRTSVVVCPRKSIRGQAHDDCA